MKRAVVIVSAVVLLAGLAGCDFQMPATPLEQVQGFLSAASTTPQDPSAMKAYFDSSAADYGSLQLSTYWETRFFSPTNGPYSILGAADGPEDPDFPGSVTVTGNVTNSVNPDPGYPAVFVLITDPGNVFANPLIRKITVTVGTTTETIEQVLP